MTTYKKAIWITRVSFVATSAFGFYVIFPRWSDWESAQAFWRSVVFIAIMAALHWAGFRMYAREAGVAPDEKPDERPAEKRSQFSLKSMLGFTTVLALLLGLLPWLFPSVSLRDVVHWLKDPREWVRAYALVSPLAMCLFFVWRTKGEFWRATVRGVGYGALLCFVMFAQPVISTFYFDGLRSGLAVCLGWLLPLGLFVAWHVQTIICFVYGRIKLGVVMSLSVIVWWAMLASDTIHLGF